MLVLILLFIISLGGCADLDDNLLAQDLARMPQSNMDFVAAKNANFPLNAPQLAKQLKSQYLYYYFSPWNRPFLFNSLANIKASINDSINKYLDKPGFDANEQLHSKDWVLALKDNINLNSFPNTRLRAITLHGTYLRFLPTDAPSFADWYAPGKGYPFDTLQVSYLAGNLPLYILQTTQDGRWQFVLTPFKSFGWVKTQDIAYVNQRFTKKFQHKNFVVALQDNKSITDAKHNYAGTIRYGELFPLIKEHAGYYAVAMAVLATKEKYAGVEEVSLEKKNAALWPILISQKNIANLADSMLNRPYGWGEMYGYRDCSGTIKDLFMPFAIWLARNSYDQVHYKRNFINLSELTTQEKAAIISKQGKPFFTLLWMQGHMMLYVGVKNGQIFVFHNPWGIRINDGKGRVVIGRTSITTVDLGKNYSNVPATYLDHVQGMAQLLP